METIQDRHHVATFAGGCFWCTTTAFDGVKGITDIKSGYIGGHIDNPNYEQVCSGTTGHYEATQITYRPDAISYTALLEHFFRQIDPTDAGGSFVDRGNQYRSAVFYHDEAQEAEALRIIDKINTSGFFRHPVATKVIKARTFYPAEDYHQNYHRKNPTQYRYYRAASGRDVFIDQSIERYNRIFKKS